MKTPIPVTEVHPFVRALLREASTLDAAGRREALAIAQTITADIEDWRFQVALPVGARGDAPPTSVWAERVVDLWLVAVATATMAIANESVFALVREGRTLLGL